MIARTCKALALAALLLAVAPAYSQYRPDIVDMGKPADNVPNPTITDKANAQLPLDAAFTASDGRSVKLGDLFNHGRPVILSLVYFSCPNLCGLTQDGLANAVRQGPRDLRVGKDYDVVVVSIDPDDTPDAARAKRTHYLDLMQQPENAPGIIYLTGGEDNIRLLADAVGFGYHRNVGADLATAGKFAHSTGIFVCTPYGRLSQTILGLQYDPDAVHNALRLATDGRIGSGFLETVALPCGAMRFNPVTGRYEQNPWFWAGAAGGLASLAFVGIFLGILWRGEFRKKKLEPPPAGSPAVHT